MRHPNIISLYDYSEDDSSYVLLMEYANKGSYLEEKLIDVSCDVMASDSSRLRIKRKSDTSQSKSSRRFTMCIPWGLSTAI